MNAHHCNACDVLRVLYACLDIQVSLPAPTSFVVLGPISQARSWIARYHTLAKYLLLLEDDLPYLVRMPTGAHVHHLPIAEHPPTNMKVRLLEYCLVEVDRATERWQEASQSSIQSITSDMMRIVANLCIVASAIASLSQPQDRRAVALEASTDKLAHVFVSTLSKPQTEQYKIDAVLETCTRILPDVRSCNELSSAVFRYTGVAIISSTQMMMTSWTLTMETIPK
jgi:ataxia telangiectasia mutated family protein